MNPRRSRTTVHWGFAQPARGADAVAGARGGVAGVVRDDDVNGYRVATLKTVQVIDDFDGTILDAYESVQFGIGGMTYDFDTTPKRAGAFRARLQKYVDISRPAGSTTPARSRIRVPATAGGTTPLSRTRPSGTGPAPTTLSSATEAVSPPTSSPPSTPPTKPWRAAVRRPDTGCS